LASAVLLIRLAATQASRHAMCRTDFCLLTYFVTSTRASSVPDASRVLSHARAVRGDRLHHDSAIRFGGPHMVLGSSRWAFFVPVAMCADRTSGIPVAALMLCTRSRVCTRMRVAKTIAKHARVNDACWGAVRNAFHRARTFAPQRSFERPAPDFPGVVAWPPQPQFSPPFHSPEILSNPFECQAPVHASRANGRSRFSEP
jgi:hypothetical protein